MPQTSHPMPQPSLPRAGHTEALLDRQLVLLTDALAERLALAQRSANVDDPGKALGSREELEKALLVAAASADLVRAKARLRGEMQLRYHVVRVEEGKKASRLPYYDPAGLEEPTPEEAARRLEEFYARNDAAGRVTLKEPTEAEMAEFLSAYPKTPDDPVPFNPNARRYDPKNPDDCGPDPEMPVICQDELTSMDGWYRYSLRFSAAKEAKAARLAAARAAVVPITTQNEGRGGTPSEF